MTSDDTPTHDVVECWMGPLDGQHLKIGLATHVDLPFRQGGMVWTVRYLLTTRVRWDSYAGWIRTAAYSYMTPMTTEQED